jgi:hypothetical protein
MTAFSWSPIRLTDVTELMFATAGHVITSLISFHIMFTS